MQVRERKRERERQSSTMSYIITSDTYYTTAVDLVSVSDRDECRNFRLVVRESMIIENRWCSRVSQDVSVALHFLSAWKSPMTLQGRKNGKEKCEE